MLTIKIDHENNGICFWDHVDTATSAPRALQALSFGSADEVEVTPAEAEEVLRWCKRAPGWAGGPSYAPHPILIIPAG